MTTRRSSSHHCSPRKLAITVDGLPIQLGNELGSGGEGAVFEIVGEPALVAKVYHRLPLPDDDVDKLHAMIASRSPELESISAWPQAILHDAGRGQPCGLLLPRVADSHLLHELYGTHNRRSHFPEAKWHHLILAARNVAAAFHSLHAAGIVVGDINQGNLLVDHGMCVRFIDCDSFQLEKSNGHVFPCPVGTPHFTPPELQSTKLRDVVRTPEHDRFGMAIMIFHLLFVGRHPFAGRFRGDQELTIEKAIGEGRFAFSPNKRETMVDPPPASLQLNELPEQLGDLFERAFRGHCDERPTAKQWTEVLAALMKRRKVCSYDASHVYFDRIKECPWCRIEDEGGPAFFVTGEAASIISKNRLQALDAKVKDLRVKTFPNLQPERLAMPEIPPLEKPATLHKWASGDWGALLMAASVVLILLGTVNPISFIAAAASALVGGVFLLAGKDARARRKHQFNLKNQLNDIQDKLTQMLQTILQDHAKREAEYETALAEVRNECDQYNAEGSQLQNVLTFQRGSQQEQYLADHLIQDNVRRIPGMSYPILSMLESFGVESARDIDRLNLMSVPSLSPSLTMELMNWRKQVESEFSFRPEHGITFKDLKNAEDAAVRRFRVWQARRVLMAAKQVGSLAGEARYERERVLREFDDMADRCRGIAVELQEYQSSRRRLERWFNRSGLTILGMTVGITSLGALLYWLLQ